MKKYRIFEDIWPDTASGLADFLQTVGDGEPIQIDIMSYGGDLFSGLAMAEMLLEAKTRGVTSTAVIYGIAASAAAILALAADRVIMTEIGSMMLHGVYHITPVGDLITDGEDIDHANARCMDIIHRRNSLYTVKMLTEKDNWYSAREAFDLGFVDEIRPIDDLSNEPVYKNVFSGLLNMAISAANPRGRIKMARLKNAVDEERKDITEDVVEEKKEEVEEVKEEPRSEGVDLKTLIVDGFSAILDRLDAIERRLDHDVMLDADGCGEDRRKDSDIMAAKIQAMYDRIGPVCKPCAKKTAEVTEEKTAENAVRIEIARNEACKKLYPNIFNTISREK